MGKSKKYSYRNLKLIKDSPEDMEISLDNHEYPLFCFKYLSPHSIKDCKDIKVMHNCFVRLQKLSELGWKGIKTSHKHGYGMGKVSKDQIKFDIPSIVPPDVEKLDTIRHSGNNLPIIGLRDRSIFRVFFIETKFGDIYNHGSK